MGADKGNLVQLRVQPHGLREVIDRIDWASELPVDESDRAPASGHQVVRPCVTVSVNACRSTQPTTKSGPITSTGRWHELGTRGVQVSQHRAEFEGGLLRPLKRLVYTAPFDVLHRLPPVGSEAAPDHSWRTSKPRFL